MYAELRSLLSTGEFEDDGSITIVGQRLGDTVLEIELAVATDSDVEPSSWSVRCEEYRRFRIQERVVRDLSIVDDHVVIAACDEKQFDLYFAGSVTSPHEAFARLVIAHHAIAGDWLPLSEFLSDRKTLSTPSGLVARAPHRIVQRYLEALREDGVDAYLANEADPKRWNGSHWIAESELLSALVFGENYVVAERFSFSREA